jgi:glycosyltransferase involved in cell wall biosynthesis
MKRIIIGKMKKSKNQNKKIKIYLQYPWKFPDSPYYKYLLQDYPKEIEYLNTKKQKGVITNKRFFWFSNFLKRNSRKWTRRLNLSIPNAHSSPKGDYDLIHCAHCLSKNKNKPWVADIEMIASFAISGWNTKKGQNKVRKILLRNNCKKILPWTESAKKEILNVYPEVKDKLEVVYPAVPEIKNLKKPKNKRLKIIFVARYFDIKGGLIALEVLEELRKKYHIEGIVVSSVPDNLKKKYSKLKIYNLMPQEKLFKLMNDSDIFLYPASFDTFGFSIIEAMSFGTIPLTIQTPNSASRSEIVINRKTGILIKLEKNLSNKEIRKYEEESIRKIISEFDYLNKNKEKFKEMSKNCLKEISSGKFSIKERNKKLKRIYQKALE